MSYKIKSKSRILKRKIKKTIGFLKVNSLNLSTGFKFILISLLVNIFSIFSTWIKSTNQTIDGNAFSKIFGITGIILIFINLIILFIVFNKDKQEKVKSVFNLVIKDGNLIVILFIFSLLLNINSVYIINGLEIFKASVIVGEGLIFGIIGSIFGIIGGYLIMKEKSTKGVIIEEKQDYALDIILNKGKIDEKNNMKLPF
ncbi:MAG: hypothetical protein NWP80_02000 [Candidatus Gracilibacteria bacterium]|nr:hypothetical protein [Candidatus Gracilibacteria bacterium]